MTETNGASKRYSVVEAAEILHTSTEAVRQRIRRGTLEATREAGRVFVVLGEGQAHSDDTDDPRSHTDKQLEYNTQYKDDFIEHLKDEIHHLRARLEDAEDRDREMRWMMGALAGRFRELPSGAAEGEASKEPPPAKREPWWVRLFG